jgi:hypothetical protein
MKCQYICRLQRLCRVGNKEPSCCIKCHEHVIPIVLNVGSKWMNPARSRPILVLQLPGFIHWYVHVIVLSSSVSLVLSYIFPSFRFLSNILVYLLIINNFCSSSLLAAHAPERRAERHPCPALAAQRTKACCFMSSSRLFCHREGINLSFPDLLQVFVLSVG